MHAPAKTRTHPIDGARLTQANINPVTGLATDYLNHFNEAVMLLELMADCPDCRDDFLAWQPMTYREHFAASHLKDRALAVEAYELAAPNTRRCLDTLTDTMTAVLQMAQGTLRADLKPEDAARLAVDSVAWLKPLVAQAGAVINGETSADREQTPQLAVDHLFKR
ncbi:MAG: hypothetical protein JO237_02560 [Pseudolabrys sp.]|nr:hypothetical protein [Pseudolabrys sp.]